MKAKKTVQNLEAYPVSLFDEPEYLKLNSNESDFGPSPKVLEVFKNISASDIQYYPYYGELLQKLADFHGVSVENIVLTAGADEAISSIIATFTEAGQTVLTVCPSFVMPKIYSKINGINYLEIPYEDKWKFPKESFFENIKKSDFVYLTTPNSPTGDIIERKTIEEIVAIAGEKAILIDETYANYADVTNLDLIKGRNNIFITRSFSKDFALAGLRLGYVISAEENIKELRKYISPYSVSTLTVKAGIAAISDIKYFENVKSEMEESKKLLTECFEKLGATVYPSKTNFICVDFGKKADFIYHKLLSNKIKVKYYKEKPLLKNCFRVGIPKLENAKKIIDILKVKPTIAFDMDGVLVDASKSYRVAVQNTFKHFSGKEVFSEEICAAKKLGGLNNDWDLTNHLLKSHGLNVNYDDIVEVFQSHYAKLADIEEILIDEHFLLKLSENYNVAVFTGRLKDEAYFTLNKHNLAKYFCPIVTLEDVGLDHQKPDCKGLEIIKEKIITDKIYYLGDTIDDMICAKTGEATGIGVLPPQDKSEDLRQLLKSNGAFAILNKAVDLIEFLEGERCGQV